MPRRDGTGPMGQGSATGRGMGNCSNSNEKLGVGFGRNKKFGQGMQTGNRFGQTLNSEIQTTQSEELAFLKQKADSMEKNLNTIKEKIASLEQE